MAKGTHCFEILMNDKLPGGSGAGLPGVIVAYGEDAFLRRESIDTALALGGVDTEAVRSYDGEECKWVDVHDELATLSLFDNSHRVALVNSADKLLKDNRPQLEKWSAAAAEGSLLILMLGSFPSNTKLYKVIEKSGWLINCGLPTSSSRSKTPDLGALKKWIVAWGTKRHELKLTSAQATLILDAVGPDCGLLHQELAKLALYADDKLVLTDELIRQNVGSWRTRTMWEIADSIADGRVADALEQLQRVFAAGEHPAAVIPQISWSLRRFGNAAHLILQSKRTGQNLSGKAAVGFCGFWGADVALAEGRLRRMGLRRASKILQWLLELDLKIKGSHSTPSRAIFALEELCMRLA